MTHNPRELKSMARREKLRQMLELDPDDPFLHYALAKESLSEGNPQQAIEELQNVIARFPAYHAAHFQLGQVLVEQGENEQARQVVSAGIEAARTDGDEHAVSEMTGFLETL